MTDSIVVGVTRVERLDRPFKRRPDRGTVIDGGDDEFEILWDHGGCYRYTRDQFRVLSQDEVAAEPEDPALKRKQG